MHMNRSTVPAFALTGCVNSSPFFSVYQESPVFEMREKRRSQPRRPASTSGLPTFSVSSSNSWAMAPTRQIRPGLKQFFICLWLLGRTFAATSVRVCGPIFFGSLRLRTRSPWPVATVLDPVKRGPLASNRIEIVFAVAASSAPASADAADPLPTAATRPAAAVAANSPPIVVERRVLIAFFSLSVDWAFICAASLSGQGRGTHRGNPSIVEAKPRLRDGEPLTSAVCINA